ncbi:hypothetical protein COU80_05080 [Candidatus Peregrinibacteria bacterium CG10_big_fil_rev_8_21_14_0_10_55_24]|nr:MAG: hypothetical protein COU80_05080 [Candidatus Peregrinibacteria bacterium CG10_big_fil_rev_8_21_14_0_10_55_24]
MTEKISEVNPYKSPEVGNPDEVLESCDRYPSKAFKIHGIPVSVIIQECGNQNGIGSGTLSGCFYDDIVVGKKLGATTLGQREYVFDGRKTYLSQYGCGGPTLWNYGKKTYDSPVSKIDVMGDNSVRVTLENGKIFRIEHPTPLPLLHAGKVTELVAWFGHLLNKIN